ncbi:SigE family RNA polymerase sigma factor [Nocardioides deserti]|uniref:SigE family RNA polymerase sigma factor n=1 Tax=Nocardioides deserti TaxID=1588644 RepID=A0ABR6U5S3_9ACTN|nr:SigE family RNA polymerase sigma factor [Nocardioides deserti]
MTPPEDFVDWVAGHRTRLLRSAYLLTGDRAQAEDLVQEAVIKVAERWGRLRSGHPTAYARTVIVHDQASWWRGSRETPSAEPLGDHALPEADHAGRSVLLSALGRLPRRQRAVVVLRYFDDLTERETAEALGVTVGTVKSQAHHALRSLRSYTDVRDLVGLDEQETTR